MKVASTKLANPEWERLQDKCNDLGLTIAEYLRNLIHDNLEGQESTLPQEGAPLSESDSLTGNNTTALERMFGKKAKTEVKQDVAHELKNEVVEMQGILRKQDTLIQRISSQLIDVGKKVDEQKRLVQAQQQSSQRNNDKVSSCFTAGTRRFRCYPPGS